MVFLMDLSANSSAIAGPGELARALVLTCTERSGQSMLPVTGDEEPLGMWAGAWTLTQLGREAWNLIPSPGFLPWQVLFLGKMLLFHS